MSGPIPGLGLKYTIDTFRSCQGSHTIQQLELAICKSMTKWLPLEKIYCRFLEKTNRKKKNPLSVKTPAFFFCLSERPRSGRGLPGWLPPPTHRSSTSQPRFRVPAASTTAEAPAPAHAPGSPAGRGQATVFRPPRLHSGAPLAPGFPPLQAPAWIRFLSNGLPLAAEGRWAPGWVSRAFLHLLTVEGAGRTMSEILCQWLNQEVKVSQTVSEWHGPGRAG